MSIDRETKVRIIDYWDPWDLVEFLQSSTEDVVEKFEEDIEECLEEIEEIMGLSARMEDEE